MDTLRKLNENFLSCAICTDTFKDPCTLACYHTFCRRCLTDFLHTRQDAISSKSVPCPSCRQMTPVPRGKEPVEQWCRQFKPSFLIQGLLDTFCKQSVTCKGSSFGRCYSCSQLGDTTDATYRCQECDILLCERCSKIHSPLPGSSHVITSLSEERKTGKKREELCPEHRIPLDYCCKECRTAVCRECLGKHHSKCYSVVPIDSMSGEMKDVLHKNLKEIESHLQRTGSHLLERRSGLEEARVKKEHLQEEVRRVTQEGVDLILYKEKELLWTLDRMMEDQAGQLTAQIKSTEIDQQTLQQYAEFIQQVLRYESPRDLCNMYWVCESGQLDAVMKSRPPGTIIKDVVFTKSLDTKQLYASLQLGHLKVTYEESSVNCTANLMRTIDLKACTDKVIPDPRDVTVLDVDETETLVVTDYNNDSLKCCSVQGDNIKALKLPHSPFCVTRLDKDRVAVSYWSHGSMELIQFIPEPVRLATIKTKKKYRCLAALGPDTLVAGSKSPPSLDVLDLQGRVLRSAVQQCNVVNTILQDPWFLSTSTTGNIFVSNKGSNSVFGISSEGQVMFVYKLPTPGHGGPRGVATATSGTLIMADFETNAILQLTERGGRRADLVSAGSGLYGPEGICCSGDKLCVTQMKSGVKVYKVMQ